MTAQVEFYSTLAGAASVFIGLLAAFIVNRIIDSKSEKKRLKTRLIQIKSEIKNEGEQRDTLHESLKRIADEIGEDTFEENANQKIEEFIEKYVGNQWYIDPDSLQWFELTRRYRKYNEDYNNYEIFALAEKFDEIVCVYPQKSQEDSRFKIGEFN
ncbi:hypothetical protein [Natrinema pallidum]|uniref:hypothetical protein n=1 Tax=Natrinema pallidum TaxID=69527 RepID=UPI00126918E3|nr:hypothetical protein [Natrinema pallidum]